MSLAMKTSILLACFALTCANLDEHESGKITADQKEVRAEVNGYAILSCNVQGDLLSKFEWRSPNGKSLTDSRIISYRNETFVRMIFRVADLTKKDQGIYKCQSHYSGGIITDYIYLKVLDLPRVHIIETRAIGSSSVYLGWYIENGGDSKVKTSIDFMKKGSQKWQAYAKRTSSELYSSSMIHGLEDATDYLFRIIASNSDGDSPAAISKWITTFEKDAVFTPNFSIKATTLDSITIQFFALPKAQHSSILDYRIILTSNGILTLNQSMLLSKDIVIRNLEPETSYKVKVAICNFYTKQCDNWTDEQEAVTMDRDPKFIPTVLIRKTTRHSITIEWSKPPPELQACIHQYNLRAMHPGQTPKSFYLKETVNTYVFENLKSNSSYQIQVRACSDYKTQCGNWSFGLEGITIDRDPEFVPTISVKATNRDSIWIGWSTPPPELQGRVHQYKVIAIHKDDVRGPIYLSDTANSYGFQNLNSDISYQVKVAACSDYKTQCGNWSDEQEVVTVDKDICRSCCPPCHSGC